MKWFGPVDRMDKYRMARRVRVVEVVECKYGIDRARIGFNGWYEGGHEQQRDHSVGFATMTKDMK